MRIVFVAKWASAATLLALSITAGMAGETLYPANVEGTERINGRVEVYNLSNTRLPASSVFSCTNRGCDFVKLSIIVKPPEIQVFKDVTKPRDFYGY
jgi:hypothetical protein